MDDVTPDNLLAAFGDVVGEFEAVVVVPDAVPLAGVVSDGEPPVLEAVWAADFVGCEDAPELVCEPDSPSPSSPPMTSSHDG